mmetsp:Transcript_49516/g.79020  ORF Transcript_49516/g.79020 Transcript_49516/m.79020 type:complete len:210 (+) Transcript_49516:151-780(+)|eukprot:CAMPEP_0197038056 /NCGR_PEP_ID=MMETSP1384-20130603/15098_1 /TAXON_ID=29189 /ORGANISM="Ammonia sp." /LENGTH=209 /DNA_ID=CAMNT_0042468449 /DNA_START=139 /DNA_END=768 /DNA_ORIENTATION=-
MITISYCVPPSKRQRLSVDHANKLYASYNDQLNHPHRATKTQSQSMGCFRGVLHLDGTSLATAAMSNTARNKRISPANSGILNLDINMTDLHTKLSKDCKPAHCATTTSKSAASNDTPAAPSTPILSSAHCSVAQLSSFCLGACSEGTATATATATDSDTRHWRISAHERDSDHAEDEHQDEDEDDDLVDSKRRCSVWSILNEMESLSL